VDLGRKVFVSLFQSPHIPLPSNQGRQRQELDSASGKGVNFQGENKRARRGFKYFFGENKAGGSVNLQNLPGFIFVVAQIVVQGLCSDGKREEEAR
jgi:hypothetical protein